MSSIEVSKLPRIESPTLEAFGHAFAGATAGAFALCILYPLDQIKVRKAVQSQSRILSPRIILDDFIHGRIENIMDIYRGLSFGILEQFSFNGVYFFFYQILKSDWKRKYSTSTQQEMPWFTSLIRGSIAGLLTQIFTTPLKVIQLRKQTASNSSTASLNSILSTIYKQHGITGFWSGMKASVILVVNPAIVQLFYGKIRKYLIAKFGSKSTMIDFFAGALSKAIATIICYPLVRIKMNLQAGHDSTSNSPILSPRPSPRVINGKLSSTKYTRFGYQNGKYYKNGIPRIREEDGENEKDDIDDIKKIETEEVDNIDIDSDEKDEKEARKILKLKVPNYVRFDHNSPSPAPMTITPSRKRASMTDIFQSTISEKGVFGLYSGLTPKLIHASLSNAITFASKEKFVIQTFAMMLYLQRINQQRTMQKMTGKQPLNLPTKQ